MANVFQMEATLAADEKQAVLRHLSKYSQNRCVESIHVYSPWKQHSLLVTPTRDLSTLVEGLTGVLKDPKKASVFNYICQMLPDEVQREFDHLAAASVSSGMMMTSLWSGEEVVSFIILFGAHKHAVQGSGLGPRHWAESGDPLDDVMFLAQVGQLPQESKQLCLTLAAPPTSHLSAMSLIPGVHTIRHVSSNQFHHGREGRGGGVPGTEELGREGRGVPGAELELKDSATRRIGGSVGG